MRPASICLTLLLFSAVPLTAGKPEGPKYEPTSNYPQQDIEGWTVYVNHRLREDQKELGRQSVGTRKNLWFC